MSDFPCCENGEHDTGECDACLTREGLELLSCGVHLCASCKPTHLEQWGAH